MLRALILCIARTLHRQLRIRDLDLVAFGNRHLELSLGSFHFDQMAGNGGLYAFVQCNRLSAYARHAITTPSRELHRRLSCAAPRARSSPRAESYPPRYPFRARSFQARRRRDSDGYWGG